MKQTGLLNLHVFTELLKIEAQNRKWSLKMEEIKAAHDRKIAVNKSLSGAQRRWCIIVCVLAFAFMAPGAGFAVESFSIDPALANLRTAESTDTGGKYPEVPALKAEWGTGVHKSYVIPALEIVGMDALLSGYNRLAYSDQKDNGRKVYNTNFADLWHNAVHGRWEIDHDNFKMNQLLHPYHGALYYGLARSAGLNYWESLGYTIFGSFLWETGGETTPPSKNDMVATGIGGTIFGESLFRMASLLLEGGGEKPGFWRELGAALLSPTTGFNRLVFGERFRPVFPSRNPAVFWYLQAGSTLNLNRSGHGSSLTVKPNEAKIDFAMSYGLPGKPGYNYTRPFDYFRFELGSLNSFKNPIENIMVHGLLLGKKYEIGDSYRGIWGLYGSYDYISPHFFRVSTSAASVGTTAQWWLSRSVALQGTGLAGLGFGSGGTTAGSGERDYHYGMTPQGLLALRFIFGNTAKFDATVREYYVSNVGATEKGRENIVRGNLSLIMRISGRHAVGIQYVAYRRDAHYPGLPEIERRAQIFSLVYTLLSGPDFKAVQWRNIPGDQK